jgi:hypothetical protein
MAVTKPSATRRPRPAQDGPVTSQRRRRPAPAALVVSVEPEVEIDDVEVEVTNEATNEADPDRAAKLLDKDPTDLHRRFAEWIITEVGYDRVDIKTVQLACALRIEFQRSEANQAALDERRRNAATKKSKREDAQRQRVLDRAAKLGLNLQ